MTKTPMNSLNRDRERKCRYCGYSEEQIKAMEGTFYETGEVKSEFVKNLIESAKAEERKRCLEEAKIKDGDHVYCPMSVCCDNCYRDSVNHRIQSLIDKQEK